MSISYLEYGLESGYIHNWLVAGPHAVAISDLGRFKGDDRQLQIARHYYEEDAGISQPPMDQAAFRVGDTELTWRYYRCLDDHFVDVSTFCHTWHYLRAWAYTQIKCSSSQEATFILTTNGPADLWLRGQHIHRQEHFHLQEPQSVSFQAMLEEGDNEILVRFEQVALQECPYVMALQITGLSSEAAKAMVVRVPSAVQRPDRHQAFEHIFDHAYLDENVVYRGDVIGLRWADHLDKRWTVAYLVQDEGHWNYLNGTTEAKAGAYANVGHPARLWERTYYVTLQATDREYYEQNMRYERRIPIHVLDTEYAAASYGTYEDRRREALENAAKREGNVFAEIAKFALGRWDQVNADLIMETIARIKQRDDRSATYLVGLLGAMHRYRKDPAFPERLKRPLEECVLNFRYWLDEPGDDAMCYTTESDSILFHTTEILAGQLYPDRTFTSVGKSGHWHWERGERMALSWLRRRGTSGFQEWDSNCCFEEDLLALSHLADLAESVEVSELAAILMDKMFFTIAINSYKGAFGSTHGRTDAPMILGSQLEATSGISRMLWGLGVFNHHILGTVGLACSEYELPPIIPAIAADLPEEVWNRECHTSDEGEVNKVTYKTPDYMLCSAQDYHAGEKGYQQHIWQATLGPDAVAFVNHPACMSENDAHRPGFWLGNCVLPRVAQWKDILIAVHRLPENDWMGFTHAYFPIRAFDEYEIRGGWAFARKGGGYLALTAAQGLELVRRGPSAYRELRSYGGHNVWLCQMGRAKIDGSFREFQQKVLAMKVDWQGLAVSCTNLRGENLSFGWEGPLTMNGKEQPVTGFKHYDNPYCVADLPLSLMEIRSGDFLVRLNFT